MLVTNNRKDFLRLYDREEVHSGLVVIVPGGLVSGTQVRLFEVALEALDAVSDLVNKVLEVEVDVDGRVAIRPWPEN